MTLPQAIVTLAELAKSCIGDSLTARLAYNDACAVALSIIDPEKARDAAHLAQSMRHLDELQAKFWDELSTPKGAAR